MSKSEAVLESANSHRHFVQLYDGTARLLARNVAKYIAEGVEQGETAIVVATPDHVQDFCSGLETRGVDPQQAIRDGLLSFLDAEEALAKFMLNGQPDWDLFHSTIGVAVREVQSRAAGRGLRVYGEMVGVLWTQGRFSAAMVLEEFWNTVLDSTEFRLFCAYPINVFGKAFHTCDVDALLCSHSHLLPGEANGPLESALNRAMSEVMGAEAVPLKERIAADPQPAWAAVLKPEAEILWLRANLREYADQILGRAQQYYYASAA